MNSSNEIIIDLFPISQKAALLLKESNLNDIFPLRLDKIASYLGYMVKLFEPSSEIQHVSGTVSREKKTILLNETESYTRQRFTLAHEIGHITLHFPKDEEFVDYNRDNQRTLKEDEADEFAGCLLMPEDVFKRQWNKNNGVYNPLSNYFGVNYAAIGLRAHRLGLE